jgi:hypothetical protein
MMSLQILQFQISPYAPFCNVFRAAVQGLDASSMLLLGNLINGWGVLFVLLLCVPARC